MRFQTNIHAACGLHVARLAKELQHTLVGAEHDGSTGHDTEHMWDQATVKRCHSFFFPYQLKTLRQARVLEPAVLLGCLS